MVSTFVRRRPRARFETVLPTPPAELPRMDVAAFVGFAASGPLDTPVLVEDPVAFREIFGRPLALAWDAACSTTVRSHLAASVDAFFENGGRRAWVVRVAGRPGRTRAAAPVSHAFELPGLVDSDALARARARSEGSWCESLAVSAFESADPMAVEVFFDRGTVFFDGATASSIAAFLAAGRDALGSDFDLRSGFTLRPGSLVPIPGDLCRLVFDADDVTVFLEVDRVVTAGAVRYVLGRGAPERLRHRAELPIPAITRVTRSGAIRRETWPLPDAVHQTASALRLEYAADALPRVDVGDLLVLELADASTARLTVTSVELGRAGGPSAGVPAHIESRAVYWRSPPLAPVVPVTTLPSAARVTLGLAVFEGDAVTSTLDGLGFTSLHPRFFGRLPNDRTLFAPQSLTRLEPVDATLRALVSSPRFALAGPEPASARYLPIGLPSGPLRAFARTTLFAGAAEDRLVRDGLDVFGAELFLDDRLVPYGAGTLLSTAEHLLHVANLTLEGLHSLVPVEEVSMIGVPDAAHLAWSRAIVAPIELLDAPVLDEVPVDSGVLTWTPVVRATRYRLEVSERASFENGELLYEGALETRDVTPAEACARLRYYRVRAETAGDFGPWSNTLALRLPPDDFAPCTEWRHDVPHLSLVASSPGSAWRLEWTRSPPVANERWEAQESQEPGFLGPTTIHSGPETFTEVPFGPEGPRYFRVRAYRDDIRGAWSNTVTLVTDSRRPAFVLEAPTSYASATRGELLALHRALLRFVAARADTAAFLTGPRHHRADDAAAYTRRLVLTGVSTGAHVVVRALSDAEQGALAHGVTLAPWVISGVDPSLEPSPPEGFVIGAVARRTIERGAWIAPANQPLAGILGTAPRATRADNDVAIAEAVNVVEADPRGFVLRTAYTLSSDGALVDLSVVRLLHLVRRWLSRLGQTYVFETNGRALAARVHDDLERALTGLWARGAFAGARASEAFEVVVGGRLDDARARDAGRFVVEVRFAPSRPLTFLLVRLVETDLGGLGLQVS